MGMSTHVKGFVPPDETWVKMKNVYDSCKEANIVIPVEVEIFFGGKKPDENGQEIDLVEHEYSGVSEDGIEIHLSEVPKNVKVIRFYHSW